MKKKDYLRLLLVFALLLLFPLFHLQGEDKASTLNLQTQGVKAEKQKEVKARKEELARITAERKAILKRQRQIREAEFQAEKARLTQQKAQQEEQKKLAAQVLAQKKQQELALKQAQLKAGQEEQARLKVEQERFGEQKETERQVKLAGLKVQKEREAQGLRREEAAKKESERKAILERQRQIREAEFQTEKARLAQQKEIRLKQLAQEKRAQQEERARLEKEHQARIVELKSQKEREVRAKKEEAAGMAAERKITLEKQHSEAQQKREAEKLRLTQEKEIRLKQLAKEKRAQQEERARLNAEQERQRFQAQQKHNAEKLRLAQEKEYRLKQLAEEKIKRQQELAFKRKLQKEQARMQEEERLNKIVAEKLQREEAQRIHREEQARLKVEQERFGEQKETERQVKLAGLKVQKEREAQAKKEEAARQAEERKAIMERQLRQAQQKREAEKLRLTQEKEARLKQLAQEKRKQEQDLAFKNRLKAEQAGIKEEERLRRLAEEKAQRAQAKKEAQVEKAGQEEQVRLKAEQERQRQIREAQARAEKARLTQQKAQQEEQKKLAAQALAQKRQQESALKQAQLKAGQEEQVRLKAEQERQRQIREAQARAEKARLAQQKEVRLRQLAEEKAQKEAQKKLEAQALVRQEKQIGLVQHREEPKTKLKSPAKSITQEKAIAEAMFAKQHEDQAKIIKIEELWRVARRLYALGMYAEAIRDFQKIIQLEGNPRIKYTPAAKEYIEKAKEKMGEQKQASLSKEVERKEKDMINEVLKQQIPPYVEPPIRLEEEKEAPLVEPPAIRKKLKKTVTLDFDKVSLETVLAFLSQETGVNFVSSQRVLDGDFNVTARFQQAPVEEAVKYITKSQGLVYRIDKDVLWIAHPEEISAETLETRVYYLSKGGGLFTEFSPITGGSSETGLGSSSAQITKISTIEDTLKEIVPWPADSKLYYDKRINALLIRNTPQNLQMLEDLIYNLDVTPYQILIEARFLEVDITDTRELGVEWGITGGDYAISKKANSSLKTGIAKDSGLDFSTFTQATEGLNLTYKGMLTNSQFNAVIHALEESKKIKTLSSPRITTLNNQMATIKVVDEWIYPSRYEFEIVQFDLNGDGDYSDAGETVYKNVPKDFLRRDVGILLKVIPSVGADRKTISLSLIPEVSEATADAFSYTGDVKLPKFTSRNLATTIVANSGDTVVLGGMIKESRTKTITKVPFLGDIPLFGAFFKKNTDSIQRKNLLIFVTAKILSPSGEEVIVAQK